MYRKLDAPSTVLWILPCMLCTAVASDGHVFVMTRLMRIGSLGTFESSSCTDHNMYHVGYAWYRSSESSERKWSALEADTA